MIKVLTIGNSFADNASEFVPDFVAAGGGNLKIAKTNLGGCPIHKHWNLVEQCDMLPEVKPYDFHFLREAGTPATLREALSAHDWTYITIQQVSRLSWQFHTFYPYFDQMFELIKQLAPQAEVLIHQTWAYRYDAPYLEENGLDQVDMFKRLKENYHALSQKLGLRILPSGEAMQRARAKLDFKKDDSFDFENAKPYELPNQDKSLIVGHVWRTGNTEDGKAIIGSDFIHCNDNGKYLTGAVWYEMLTGNSILDNTFVPENANAEIIPILKQAAHDTVVDYGGPLRGN